MPKLSIVAIVIGAVVVVGGGALLVANMNKPAADNGTESNATTTTNDAKVKLDDPEGVYDFVSDPGVTKYPEANAVFGNGQTFTFEYDGTKTNNDPYATLSYQLYYIQADGKVQPMGGGNLSGRGSGTFSTSDSVFNSAASGASGFFELQGTYDTSIDDNNRISGSNVTLGMYPVKFEIDE